MIEACIAGKKRDGLSWWTREGLKGVLASIFAAAIEWKLWTGENPTVGVRIGRKEEKRQLREKAPLTSIQLQAILAAVSERTRFMILIAVLIGLSVSEMLGLRWGDIDVKAGTLRVQKRWYRGDLDEPKNEYRKRTRELGPLAEEFQSRYPGPHKQDVFVFLGDDGVNPLDERDVLRYELRPALKRLGLYFTGFGWHQFRPAEHHLAADSRTRNSDGGAAASRTLSDRYDAWLLPDGAGTRTRAGISECSTV